jgi:molybdate transport system substrate-binding protein
MSPRARPAAVLLAAVLAVSGCGGSGAPAPSGPAAPRASTAPTGAITVLAAASLTEAFTRLRRDFEAAHPGSTVSFSFGSSATLATQVTQGAPADVFAAASPATMRTVTDAGAATRPVDFVTNTLELAVPSGNPAHVRGLADLANPRLRIALCAPQVPCGAAAVTVLAAAGVDAQPDTLESDVKAVLQKVTSDEVDAALVYRTDVRAAGDALQGIEFPEAAQAVNRYPLAVLTESRNPTTAQAFVDHVLSADGRRVLTEAGFGPP